MLVALIGYAVGCLGPSTAIGFAPMWILFGLALAVIVRAENEAHEHGRMEGARSADDDGGGGGGEKVDVSRDPGGNTGEAEATADTGRAGLPARAGEAGAQPEGAPA